MKKALYLALVVFGLAFAARAQDEVPPPMPAAPAFTDAQVDQLVGPVALYPDPLLGVLLPAATLPTQIVMADRYINDGGDPSQMDPQTFDQNVIALAHYPDVLKWMDDNLNWTTQLGQAFENQQEDVMNSVQRLRMTAYNLGNLQSTPQQQVINDNGYIEILPANPDNVYVPSYMPTQVFYQQPYGPPFITFSVGFVIGPWLCSDPDWWHHRFVCWNHANPRPRNWWFQNPAQRQAFLAGGHANVWNANNRGGVVPGFHGGDRGWNNQQAQGWNNQFNHTAPGVNQAPPPGAVHGTPPGSTHAVPPGSMHPMNQGAPVNHGENIPNNPRWNAPVPDQPAPQPTESFGQNDRNDAFISSQNAQDARTFSNRGAQSTGTQSHSSGGGFHGGTGGGGGAGGFHGSTSGGSASGGGSSSSGSQGGGGGGGGGHGH